MAESVVGTCTISLPVIDVSVGEWPRSPVIGTTLVLLSGERLSGMSPSIEGLLFVGRRGGGEVGGEADALCDAEAGDPFGWFPG